ncbi:MAG: LysR family transcriptional regulator [Eggerthellaceae bacterium]|nr:LysR family transcriptional regulator [Eggerthellaceae bacterium]
MLLQQIESFIAVAEAANFTHAAQRTHISQPTLSRQVKMLEDELGCALFQRSKRPLRLTEAGEIFYDGMKRVLGQMDYTREMTRAAAQGRSGKLSIGFTTGIYAEYMFLDVINDLKDTCRSLDVTCAKKDTEGLVKGLLDESIDVAFSLDFPHFEQAGLRVTPLVEVPTVIVMSADHPLATKNTLGYDDLDGQTLYLNAPLQAYRLETWMGQLFNLDRIGLVEVGSIDEAYMKVLSEEGLSISNAFDPILQNNLLYHCYQIPNESLYPFVCAVGNPGKRNAAKELLLELVRRSNLG